MKTKQDFRTDEQLVARLQHGDKNAMSELYLRYYMLVYNKCWSFAKNTNDATDLTHDVMLRVMEKICSFKGSSKFSTWLYRITFNYCTDQQRKNKGRYHESLDSFFDLHDASSDEKAAIKALEEKKECARKALSAINPDDQQLLLMKYCDNKSIHELQELYQLSASAIKMRLMRAREKATQMFRLKLVA